MKGKLYDNLGWLAFLVLSIIIGGTAYAILLRATNASNTPYDERTFQLLLSLIGFVVFFKLLDWTEVMRKRIAERNRAEGMRKRVAEREKQEQQAEQSQQQVRQ